MRSERVAQVENKAWSRELDDRGGSSTNWVIPSESYFWVHVQLPVGLITACGNISV